MTEPRDCQTHCHGKGLSYAQATHFVIDQPYTWSDIRTCTCYRQDAGSNFDTFNEVTYKPIWGGRVCGDPEPPLPPSPPPNPPAVSINGMLEVNMQSNTETTITFTGNFQVFPADVASFVLVTDSCKMAPHPEGTAGVVGTDLSIKVTLSTGTYKLCLFQNNELKAMEHVKFIVADASPPPPPPPSPPPPPPPPPPEVLLVMDGMNATQSLVATAHKLTTVTFAGSHIVHPGDFAVWYELPNSPHPPPPSLPQPPSPPPFEYTMSIHRLNMKYDEANENCQNQSQFTKLAIVDSHEKLTSIGQRLKNQNIQYAMIDMKRTDGVYKTYDGAEITFFEWETTEPEPDNDFKCVIVVASSMKMRPTHCSWSEYHVCDVIKPSPPPPSPLPPYSPFPFGLNPFAKIKCDWVRQQGEYRHWCVQSTRYPTWQHAIDMCGSPSYVYLPCDDTAN